MKEKEMLLKLWCHKYDVDKEIVWSLELEAVSVGPNYSLQTQPKDSFT